MRKNYIVFALLILLAYIAIGARLFYLQVIKGDKYYEESKQNYTRLQILYPPRGTIESSDGKKLAYDVPTYDLYIDPQEISENKDLSKEIEKFKNMFGIDITNIIKVNKNSITPIKIMDNLSTQQLETFYANSYKFPGIFVGIVPKRVYPYGDEYAHILGYVGLPSQKDLKEYKIGPQSLVGKAGIEKRFNKYLIGELGYKKIMVNALGKELYTIDKKLPVQGDTVVLTINSQIQDIVHKVFLSSGQKVGAVIVMNAHNGEILALDSFPEYNPNDVYKDWDKIINNPLRPFLNRATEAIYPPGSVFKVPIAIAALKYGVITPSSTLDCSGYIKVGNHIFYNWIRYDTGYQTIVQAIQNSCDTFFYQLGMKLGQRKIYEIEKDFGYGSSIPFELYNSPGFLPTKSWKLRKFHQPWYEGDTVNMSIGQGYVLVTLLQQVTMMEGIANNGVIYQPTLLKEIKTADGKIVFENHRKVYKYVRAPLEDYSIVKKGLREVVLKGTGTNAFSTIVDIAGKTGTAQVVFGKHVGPNSPWKYQPDAWFVGFAPYRDPKYVVGVVVEHGIEGNLTAAPILKRILEQIYIKGINREIN